MNRFVTYTKVNAPGDRPRDTQRQKLYNAEREALAAWDAKVGSGTLADAQAWVDRLCQERWFQSRWGRLCIRVRQKTHGSATANQVALSTCLPPWARCPRVILHEVAHLVTPEEYAWHGPEYAARFLLLVRYELGEAAARLLREGFARHKVSYRSGVASLPPPNAKRVVTQTMERERRKAAETRPVSALEAKQAAGILKRAVKNGMLGAAGTKQRSYALLIVRTLEEKSS